MVALHHFSKLAAIDMGVDLGRTDVGMAQQFLDDPEIGSAHQQVGRETVPKLVRVDVLQPCDLGVFTHDLPDRDSLQWPPAE